MDKKQLEQLKKDVENEWKEMKLLFNHKQEELQSISKRVTELKGQHDMLTKILNKHQNDAEK